MRIIPISTAAMLCDLRNQMIRRFSGHLTRWKLKHSAEEKTARPPLFNPAKGKQAKPDSPGIERSHV